MRNVFPTWRSCAIGREKCIIVCVKSKKQGKKDIVFTDMRISAPKLLNWVELGTGACAVPLTNFVFVWVSLSHTLPISVAARSKDVGLRPLACWDCAFESRWGHVCLSVLRIVCCEVEVSATGWSLVQRSPTDCDASLCVIYKLQEWGGHCPLWAAAPRWEKITYFKRDFIIFCHIAKNDF